MGWRKITSWARVSCRKKSCLLSSGSRLLQGLMWSEYDSFYYVLWTVDYLATKLVWWCIIIIQSVLWSFFFWWWHARSRSQWRVKTSMFVQMMSSKPLNIYYQTWYGDTSPWARVHAKRLVYYFQGQGLSKGSHNQNMTVPTISAELLILLLPNLVGWYITISQNVLWKKWIIAFKVKITVKSQNVGVCPDDILLPKMSKLQWRIM